MNHDTGFAAFRERKRAAEAARYVDRVTWRKVSPLTGGGWSGLGPGGRLFFVRPATRGGFEYGEIIEGQRRILGNAPGPVIAKRAIPIHLRREAGRNPVRPTPTTPGG